MNIDEVKNILTEQLSVTDSLPFLFIGSGFSKRYIKTESWENLLSKFAEFGECKNINQYISEVEDGRDNLDKVASKLAEDFSNNWWKLNKFDESRNQYSKEIINKNSSLKLEIANYLKNIDIKDKLDKLDDDLKNEIQEFRKIKIDGIFTTNYDLLLENLFDDYCTFINQKNILNSRNYNINEIYKIHGCCTDFNNIVLTEEDYKKFKKDNLYVMAKLLTIFVEHPVIFIGYSLNDKYIREIITSIADIVGVENLEKLKDKFIFISRSETEVTKSTREIQIDSKYLSITDIKLSNFMPIFEVLSSLKRKVPSKLLRYMKEEIYEFSKNGESKEKFGVIDIDEISTENYKDIEFVIGVGIKKKISKRGYSSFENTDIFEQILKKDSDDDFTQSDYKNLIEITVPSLKRKQSSMNLPFNKFLYKAELKINDLDIAEEDKQKLIEFNQKDLTDSSFQNSNSDILKKSLSEIIKSHEYSLNRKLSIITSLPTESISVDELYNYLLENKDTCLYGDEAPNKSKFYKAVCLYDRLKFME